MHPLDVPGTVSSPWTDPRNWEVNAAGQVTPAQRSLIAGPQVQRPYFAWALLTIWAAIEAGAAWLGGTPRDYPSDMPNGGVAGALAAMGLIGLITVWWFALPALITIIPRYRARRWRRRRLADLAAGRISSGVGVIAGEPTDGVEARVLVKSTEIAVPDGAPSLPPPGPYRLYWLDPAPGRPPLLLSAQPVDVPDDDGEVPSGRADT